MVELWQRNEADSPCVNICVIHPPSGLCMGCLRSVDEIAGWGGFSPEQRRLITTALPERAPQIKPQRRGGRKNRT